MKGRRHNEFSKCHLKAYVSILLASAQGIDALFSTSCFPTSCPWLRSFACPHFDSEHAIFSSFSFDLLHLRIFRAHASTAVPLCPPIPPQTSSRVRAGDRLQQSSHIFHNRRSPCRARDVEVCGVGTASFAIFILSFFFSSEDSYSMHILQWLEFSPLTSFSLYQKHAHTHTHKPSHTCIHRLAAEPPTSSHA